MLIAGVMIVSKLTKTLLLKRTPVLKFALRSSAGVFNGNITAFMIGWQIGFCMGKNNRSYREYGSGPCFILHPVDIFYLWNPG
jgi:hypothetical protein